MLRARSGRPWAAGLAAGAVLLAAGCENSGIDLGFPPAETGTVLVTAYLDRDGSRLPNFPLDTLFPNARVALLLRGANDTLRTALTNSIGQASFTEVPLGEYRVAVVPASLGDSIQVGAIDSTNVRLELRPDTVRVTVRLSFPEVDLRQARALPIGKRVFARGIILSGVQSFRDTTSHVADSTGAIRLTRVVLRGGLIGNNPGDSVSVLGLTSTRLGQPTLDLAVITRFATRPPPIPNQVTTGAAATANGGVLDANLVQVFSAAITDTATTVPDFRVTVSDGSGALVILLDGNINFQRNAFFAGRSVNAIGVLVPDGLGGWSLKPRQLSDVVVF
jgi:hypothetical protein